MINDFDLLLKKCKARAFKRILRIALRILASIFLFGLGVFGYFQWKMSTQETVIIKPSSPLIMTPTTIKEEENITIPPTVTPEVMKVTISPTPIAVPIPNKASPAPTNSLLEVSTASDSMTPEQAYQRSPKFETALDIARNFYTKENYSQAAIWAKKANHMNREAEEAWLLYAKSYYAQGKKNEAIGVLELFLNYKDSKAANDLIKIWR